jgi:hypothetical protein
MENAKMLLFWRLKLFMIEKISKSFFSSLVMILAACLMSLPSWAQEQYDVSDSPGDLSAVHQDSPGIKNCSRCHNEDFEVPPAMCLSCHQEIAMRISDKRGYHRDKGDDCIVCHSEHQGPDEPIVPLDPEDFDHEETGAVLKGIHLEIKDCRRCHRRDNTLPRKKTQSYLFKASGCLVCHTSPHPGHQEKCQTCHSQKNWEVDIWLSKGIR